jgi:hypothetical protein
MWRAANPFDSEDKGDAYKEIITRDEMIALAEAINTILDEMICSPSYHWCLVCRRRAASYKRWPRR